jgi:NAD(P)H-flavin reductase
LFLGLKNIGLLAVGTGITPMWQLIQEIFKNERYFYQKISSSMTVYFSNTTKITLLYGNRYEHDILLRDRLEKLAKSNPTRFKVIFTLSKPDFTWDKEKGRIGKEIIEKYFPAKNFDACFLCGTLRMMDDSKTHLTSIGHNPSNVFKY